MAKRVAGSDPLGSLDPEIEAWQASAPAPPTTPGIEGMREAVVVSTDRARARLAPEAWTTQVRDEVIPGHDGADLRLRIFTPPAPSGRIPLVVYLHGGAWTVGDVNTHRGHAGRLAVDSGAVVVAVDYRRAPEHRFPAAYDDALTALSWCRHHATDLGADPALLVVAGDSAGGQLAASVALAARDAAERLAAQLLLYPAVDLVGGYVDETRNARYPSRSWPPALTALPLSAMAYGTAAYLGDLTLADDPRATPLLGDLSGVARPVVHLAGLDLLLSEGLALVSAFVEHGVEPLVRKFEGLNHGYFGLGGVSRAAEAAAATAGADLRSVLGLGPLPR